MRSLTREPPSVRSFRFHSPLQKPARNLVLQAVHAKGEGGVQVQVRECTSASRNPARTVEEHQVTCKNHPMHRGTHAVIQQLHIAELRVGFIKPE